MNEDHGHPQDPAEAKGSCEEDYLAPTLTDLGSFEQLTDLGGGIGGDIEATSGSA